MSYSKDIIKIMTKQFKGSFLTEIIKKKKTIVKYILRNLSNNEKCYRKN